MVIKSFSKINLSLSINKKLKHTGLHEIQSYFCLLTLHDKILIKKNKAKKDKVIFHGKFGKYVNKKNNSITKILKILRRKKLISAYYFIKVKKNIPVFSGLGGGTSNAAFVAKFLLKNKVNDYLIHNLSKEIGSDFPIFFFKQGFLENLKTIKKFKKRYTFHFLLIRPKINCSTQYIYSKVKDYRKKVKFTDNKISTKSKFLETLKASNNDLQNIVEKKYLPIKKIINEISDLEGSHFSRMTGSGSVCFGLFTNKKRAKATKRTLLKIFPKYWCAYTKTI